MKPVVNLGELGRQPHSQGDGFEARGKGGPQHLSAAVGVAGGERALRFRHVGRSADAVDHWTDET